MSLTSEELRRIYQRHTSRPRGECPDAATVVDAASGKLDLSQRESLADHLVGCSKCAEEYRLLSSLCPDFTELFDSPGSAATPDRLPSGRAQTFIGSVIRDRLLLVAVVILLVICGGLIAWVVSLRQENRQMAENASLPQLNLPIFDLDPSPQRGPVRDRVSTLDLPASTRFFAVILHVPAEPSFSDYELIIRDGLDRVIWQGSGIKEGEFGTFTVALPGHLLPPGQYRLDLYGLKDDGKTLIEEYGIRIRPVEEGK